MKFSRLVPLIYLSFGVINNSIAVEGQPIDTEHKDLVVGTITIGEFEENLINFLESHPEYKDQLALIKSENNTTPKNIQLLKLAPNPNYIPNSKKSHISKIITTSYPSSKILDVPGAVYNQGNFGTCVTFATIGAIASGTRRNFNNGPSASCLLQMTNSNGQNNWEGSWIYQMFPWFQNQGFITEQVGQTGFCNSTYPTYQPFGSTNQEQATLSIPTSTYVTNSMKIVNGYYYEQSFSDPNNALNYLKQEINDTNSPNAVGFFPEFAFYYSNDPVGSATINGVTYPVWVDPGYVKTTSGHAVYAYGYDDNITVNGQKGVIYLRNSWGTAQSVTGNYLMTYQYFLKNFRTDDVILAILSQCQMTPPPRVHCV